MELASSQQHSALYFGCVDRILLVRCSADWCEPCALFSIYNFQKNTPNLIVQGNAPDDWYIETHFRIDWSTVPLNHYVQAGIVIATDADNYFQVYISREVNSGDVVGSTALEDSTNYNWGGGATGFLSPSPADERLGLRIRHLPADESNPARIELSYWKESVGDWQPFWHAPGPLFYPAGSEQYNFIQNLISQAGSVRVGLYTATSDSDPPQLNIFEFDYFETNLPVQTRASLGDVNGDCVVDDADLLAVLFAFGTTGACLEEDVNGDEVVDDADLLTVLFEFGTGC